MREELIRLLKYTKRYSLFMLGAFICSIFSVVLILYVPVLTGNAIDHILEPGKVSFELISPILVKIGFCIIGAVILQWIMAFFTNKVAHKTVQDLRISVYNKINELPLGYIDTKSHGDIMSRIVNDVDQISDGLLQGLTQLFSGVVTIVGTIIFMLSVNAAITAVVVVLTPLSLFVASFIAKHSHKMFIKQQERQGELAGYIEEYVGNRDEIKAFGYEERSFEEFNKINQELYICGQKAQFYSSLANPSTRFVNGIVYTAVAVSGSICAVTGWPVVLTIGKISSFLVYANQYTKPFNEITSVITQLQAAIAAAGRVFEILDAPATEAEEIFIGKSKHKIQPEVQVGNKGQNTGIEMKSIYFSYIKDKPLLKDISFKAEKGERIAVVGPTGCGKTTLINLLMRFYEIDKGSITIDGVDINEIPRRELRSKFGMVLQDTWLFTGTVKENIAYGKPDATDEEIIAAAKAAHANYFITRLPKGYDTIISDGDGNISAGQRQLLCIARVMLIDPPILILDEATSSIDTRTEIHVQKAFDKMMEGRTSLVVAHRLSTIRKSDCILVMKDGSIEEKGTHEELMKNDGFYKLMFLK